uniref:Centrosome and spindle pole associated protein 1a n=1 Tax=Seriola lalandi dorsalis TaxID=1841481 RepID=A0A3B4YUA1_SERLL
MDDELENFIRERKARVAEDKASLDQDPPYMEIKVCLHDDSCVSTVKENIPPKSIAQGKGTSSSVGLPLGVEYERKKQRLQHELRMDYRRYMAQQHLLGDQTGVLPKQRPSSWRDAATLTEDNMGLQRALRLAEVKTLYPEEEEEQLSLTPRLHDRLGRPVDQDSEEEEYFKEELELMEGRRCRHMGIEASYPKRRTNKTDGRFVGEINHCVFVCMLSMS